MSGVTATGSVGELLRAAVARLSEVGSESARLDAELLLGHVLGVERATVLAHPEAPVGGAAAEAFDGFVVRRAAGEPVAYIRGLKEFYGLAFAVDRRALIPRPETERLVELAEARISEALTSAPRPEGSPLFRLWDVGTGCGAIAVTLAVLGRRRGYSNALAITATDRSAKALELAVENAVAHGVADSVSFGSGDLFSIAEASTPVEMVVANLPYVPSAEVPGLPVAASFEPVDALDGGSDGLQVIRRLLAELPNALSREGAALIEIGSPQAAGALAAASEVLPGWPAQVAHDLSGRPRVLIVERP